jgi:hypothetical protein
MAFSWSKLFVSERNRIKPVLLEDVKAAEVPDKVLEEEQSMWALKLMAQALRTAELSGKIRQRVNEQVALQIQGVDR